MKTFCAQVETTNLVPYMKMILWINTSWQIWRRKALCSVPARINKIEIYLFVCASPPHTNCSYKHFDALSFAERRGPPQLAAPLYQFYYRHIAVFAFYLSSCVHISYWMNCICNYIKICWSYFFLTAYQAKHYFGNITGTIINNAKTSATSSL